MDLFSTSINPQVRFVLVLNRLYSLFSFLSLFVHVCVRRYAAAVQDGSQYFVLLIITDGVISDMAQTKEAIVNVRRGKGGDTVLYSTT